MNRQMSPSVTDVPCRCGYLSDSAAAANCPIRHDPALNEYYFEHKFLVGSVAKLIIYHCPMCGGVASRSARGNEYYTIPENEIRRLQELTLQIETTKDIERVLGEPDFDETIVPPKEVASFRAKSANQASEHVRVLTFVRLSEIADVQFTVFSVNKLQGNIIPKRRL